jgi:hypothetical protein
MQLTHYTKFLKRTNRSIGTSGVRGVYTALRKVSTEVEFSSLGLGRLECFLSAGRVCDQAGDGIREHDDRALRFGRRFPQFSKLDIGGEGEIRTDRASCAPSPLPVLESERYFDTPASHPSRAGRLAEVLILVQQSAL